MLAYRVPFILFFGWRALAYLIAMVRRGAFDRTVERLNGRGSLPVVLVRPHPLGVAPPQQGLKHAARPPRAGLNAKALSATNHNGR